MPVTWHPAWENRVVVAVGKLSLDGVRVPQPHFIQQRGGHRPEAVAGHFILCVAHPAQGGVDRVLRHGAID